MNSVYKIITQISKLIKVILNVLCFLSSVGVCPAKALDCNVLPSFVNHHLTICIFQRLYIKMEGVIEPSQKTFSQICFLSF